MSADAILTAVIAAVDAPGYARNISVDAIRTAVIVEVGSPLFTRTISVDVIRITLIVAMITHILLALFRLMH